MQMESCDAFEEFAERALSFCDLVEERGEFQKITLRDSNAGSSDFDFEFGRAPLSGDGGFLAQTLGPEFQPDAQFSWSKSNSCAENRIGSNEKLQAWRPRNDSMDSQSSSWSSFSSTDTSRGSLRRNSCSRSHENVRSGKSKANWTATTAPKPPPPGGKTSPKWKFLRQILTPGLMAAPTMKLEDMRFRQVKGGYNNAVESNIDLKRSLSCTCDAEMEAKVLSFQQKSKSVKTMRRAEEMSKPRRSWMSRPFLSLFGCKASMNSVVNCSTAKKQLPLVGDVTQPETMKNILLSSRR